jgi:NAD(P)-dependent dehydrogenase (short-subunit alcohol dehydrogenase family)
VRGSVANRSAREAGFGVIDQAVGVTIREAGWLLTRSESQVRRLVQTGTLVYAVRPTRLTVESVSALFSDDALRPIREAALATILEGRLRAPAPIARYARPVPITELARLLAEANPARPVSNGVFDASPKNDRFRNTSPLYHI